MNKRLLDTAIECHMPMYWIQSLTKLHLRVVTAHFENGKERSRLVHSTAALKDAYKISRQIFASGGNLACDELINLDDPWRFGWEPPMAYEKDLIRMIAASGNRYQPLWDEFRERIKKGK
jgi:hypothetical protein